MAFVITEACLDVREGSCVPECPADCIYEGDRILYINPDECIDCGACRLVCPNDAPVELARLAAPQRFLADAAREWVVEHAAEGGAVDRGRIGVDHASVTAL